MKGKGGNGGKGETGKVKGKGYGECWNCSRQGHPSRECLFLGKLRGGVGAVDVGIAAVLKGKGKYKGKRYGKGTGYWKGKGKGDGNRSLNMAPDLEYMAAWHQEDGDGSGEHTDYYDYCNGRNYAMTNDHNWNRVGQRYSMMLTKVIKPIIIGPKYSPAGMNDNNEDDESEGETSRHLADEPNSKCKCTVIKSRFIANIKTKKHQGVVDIKHKKSVAADQPLYIGDDDVKNQDMTAIEQTTRRRDDNFHEATHNNNNMQNANYMTNYTTRPTARRASRQCRNDSDDEAVRDAAAAEHIFLDDWTGIRTTNKTTCNIYSQCHNNRTNHEHNGDG